MLTDTQLIIPAIIEAHLNLIISDESISFFSMVTKMQDAIVSGYDGTPFEEYINRWNRSIVEHFRTKKIDLVSFNMSSRMLV